MIYKMTQTNVDLKQIEEKRKQLLLQAIITYKLYNSDLFKVDFNVLKLNGTNIQNMIILTITTKAPEEEK